MARFLFQNLLARYDLSRGYQDLSGNGYHGQAGLSAGVDSADPTGSFFDGIDDVVALPNIPIGSAFTLYALCRPTNATSVRTVIGTNTNQSYLGINSNGRPIAAVVDASQISISGIPITFPRLVVLGLSVGANHPLRMLQNRTVYSSNGAMSSTFPSRTLTAIGRNGTAGTLRMLGDIDDVLAYAGTHNPSEMRLMGRWLEEQALRKGLGKP